MKNFGEKEAWAYPGIVQIFWVPPIISGMGKATDFIFCMHIGSIGTKAHFGKSSRGRCQRLLKIFRAPIHRAHRAVIFATAQLSCLYLYAFQRYCRFCAPERHFSHPTSSLPKISPCSPGSRWMTFGLRRANWCWAKCPCN